MRKSNCRILVAIITIEQSGFSTAEEISRDDALELMEECERQREEKIAPLRDQAIEDCVTNRRGDREHCERFNRTFGNARPRAGGGMTPRMFWELPDCQNAFAASETNGEC
jgi:hypothetical protein